MPYTFDHQSQVAFAETDLAGIVHFANYFRYMENAEHAFFRSLGLSVHGAIGDTIYGWPRVKAECDFRAPLRFEDIVHDRLFIVNKKPKALEWLHILGKESGNGFSPCAIGRMTTVCVTIDVATGKLKSSPIPPELDEKLDVAPEAEYADYLG